MNDRDALLAAILMPPDEDTPRLAFADYLEENGEGEYAAFIHKQIELAKVPEWDPLWVRAKYLAPDSISGDGWPRPEPPGPIQWGGPMKRGTFHRGFPSAVSVFRGAPFRDELAGLVRVAPVDDVTWYASGPNDRSLPHWSALVGDPIFARVRSLTPALVRLTDRDIHDLHDSPHARLTELNLLACYLSREQGAMFLRLPRFRQLRTFGLRILDEGSGDITEAATRFANHRLDSLHLSCGEARGRSPLLWGTDFLSTPLFRGLKELDLSEHLIGPADARALVRSHAVAGLESLRLRNCQGGHPLAIELAGCAGLSALRQLDLTGNEIGPDGARALAESPYLTNLCVLDLCDNPVGDDGATAIARSPFLTQLLDLNLLFGGVGDTGAQAILDSPLSETLVHLDLHMSTMRMVKGQSPITEPVGLRLRERFGARLVLDCLTAPLA